MELPNIGDIVGVEETSQGIGTGNVIEVEVLHVHTIRKTGRVQVQVRSTKPVHLGRMVGRKADYSARIATQYVDQQWLRPRPALRPEPVQDEALIEVLSPKPKRTRMSTNQQVAAIAALGMAAAVSTPGRKRR